MKKQLAKKREVQKTHLKAELNELKRR